MDGSGCKKLLPGPDESVSTKSATGKLFGDVLRSGT
jgi:hypothetical protein